MRALISMLVLFSCTAAYAQGQVDTLKRIADTGEIRIGFSTDEPPMSFKDAEGKVAGYSIALCRHIATAARDAAGLKEIKTVFVPLVTMEERIAAVENGDVDIECGSTTVTLSRRERVDFTLMTFITGSAVLSLKSNPIDTIDDIDGKKIAVMAGSTTKEVMQRVMSINDFKIKLQAVDSHDEAMELLNAGKVDGFSSDRAMLIGQVFRNADARNSYMMTRTALSFEPYAFMVPRGDTKFRLVADRALAAQFRGAGIRRLYHDWIGRYGEPLSPIVAAMYEFQAVGE
ncbi:MAG: amino acid ABC transporter substrate-binding protein [Woeseiaceae bacterium]